MKCPRYEATKAQNMEKSTAYVLVSAAAAAEELDLSPKALSPVKDPMAFKQPCPPAGVTKVPQLSLNNSTRPIHNKENNGSRELDRALDEGLEDSGYLSLHNSQIDEHHGDEEETATILNKTISPNNSPSKCQERTDYSCLMPVVAASTPVDHCKRKVLSNTASDHTSDANLPILKFQQAVCEELAKGYRKNKRYDWSIVTKVAEEHLLDRVIGGQMGCEYVDVFTSLLSRNMRSILTDILALLGDMDLISCKKVSRTWRKIICEDTKALNRCQLAEEKLRVSRSSLKQKDCSLTRDTGVSRMVLSCLQSCASVSTPASSSSSSFISCRVSRRPVSSQKALAPNYSRFNEFVKAADTLKQHESLRSCKRCGSPATHSTEAKRAICTRASCSFDFCTCCQEAFHGSTPCRTVQPRAHLSSSNSKPILPGSARSKRNVRRL